MLDLEGGKIFSVAQHQNDPNLNFLCLESKQVELYHRGAHFYVVCKHLIATQFIFSSFNYVEVDLMLSRKC